VLYTEEPMTDTDGISPISGTSSASRRFPLTPRGEPAPQSEGLRERKKRLTRQRISDTATALFLERGFDQVTVADVARACDVSEPEKTVYNYFPSKESLVLDQEETWTAAIRQALAPGTNVPPKVFGFHELVRVVCVGNWIAHAEIECEGGDRAARRRTRRLLPRKDYRKPSSDGHVCAYAHMMVSEVDSHFDRAKAEGATIVHEPQDQEWGLRQYTARDYEGHVWEFCQFIKDIPPEEWEATTAFATSTFPGA